MRGREILAETFNRVEELKDATAHAELLALKEGFAKTGEKYLPDCDLYVTLEPCAMCAAALSWARVRRVYVAARDPKSGGIFQGPMMFTHATVHHKPEVLDGGYADESAGLLKAFFKAKRG